MLLSQIRVRDPFVVRDDDTYLLFGTTDDDPWSGPGTGFDCWRSRDLREWHGPHPAFRPPAGFWGTTQFWAPEVHRHDGRWAMLATFADGRGARGTQVLVADEAAGPYVPWSEGPVTPREWQCLDGTLHVDGAGAPWIVYCHEWLQAHDGAMYAQRLRPDLRAATGDPVLLFRASQAPWSTPFRNTDTGYDLSAHITDGPWLRRTATGALVLLWSSGGPTGYAIGMARSATGHVTGPWVHDAEPLWPHDGGHGMVLDTPEGPLLVFHAPNDLPRERVVLERVSEVGERLVLARRAS